MPQIDPRIKSQTLELNGRLRGSVDEADDADDLSLCSYYVVLGYPASRSQTKINHETRKTNLIDFHLSTSPPDREQYTKQNLAESDHILLEFDQKNVQVDRKKTAPPSLKGCSGGGIFHISRIKNEGLLTAIFTEHHANSKVLVGTRIKHFLAAAKKVKSDYSPEIFM